MTSRVLSIQSHVTYGYVGGKAATFPLQCLGYDVDAVNTVDFSNHSGYGRFGGSRTTAQDITTVFDVMEANGLLTQERLLTGYVPGAEALSVIARLAKKLKAANTNLIYLLDPVLGDSGRLYVAPDVIPIYRELLPQATIITPNWFEVETLTGIPLKDMHALRRALRILHKEYQVPNVVISSIPLYDFLRDVLSHHLLPSNGTARMTSAPEYLLCIASSYNLSATANGSAKTNGLSNDSTELSKVHAHVLPCIPGYFSGVGDLFSALVLGHFQPPSGTAAAQSIPKELLEDTSHTPLSIAVSFALSKTFGILKYTDEEVSALDPMAEDATDEERDRADPERRVRRMRTRELRLIQGQSLLRAVPMPSPSTDQETGLELREMRPWYKFWTQSLA